MYISNFLCLTQYIIKNPQNIYFVNRDILRKHTQIENNNVK